MPSVLESRPDSLLYRAALYREPAHRTKIGGPGMPRGLHSRSVRSDAMTVDLLAEAGLSECVRSGADCMPGFGRLLGEFALVGFGVVLWVALASVATIGVVSAKTGMLGRAGWAVVVWGVPVLGALSWFVCTARSSRTSIAGSAVSRNESAGTGFGKTR